MEIKEDFRLLRNWKEKPLLSNSVSSRKGSGRERGARVFTAGDIPAICFTAQVSCAPDPLRVQPRKAPEGIPGAAALLLVQAGDALDFEAISQGKGFSSCFLSLGMPQEMVEG